MRNIVRLIQNDWMALRHNVIALVVCVGLIIIPSLYAWFNIAASWDPYAHTDNLTIAVANTDEGYTSDIIPMELNVGNEVVNALRAEKTIHFEVLSKDEATSGVKAGTYYAALIIPPDFSKNLLGGLQKDPKSTHLMYITNQKENAIANLVTDKASSAVKTRINETFTKTISQVSTKFLSQLSEHISGDNVSSIVSKLQQTSKNQQVKLHDTADLMRSYADLLQGLSSSVSASQNLLDATHNNVQELKGEIKESSSSLSDDAKQITDATKLDDASVSFDEVARDIHDALALAQSNADLSAHMLNQVADKLEKNLDVFTSTQELLARHDIHNATLDGVISSLKTLIKSLRTNADTIQKSAHEAVESEKTINDELAAAKKAVENFSGQAQDLQTEAVSELHDKLGSARSQIDEVINATQQLFATTAQTLPELTRTLSHIESKLRSGAQTLDDTASKLQDLQTTIEHLADTKDITSLRHILASDSDVLSSFVASPVELRREAIYPIENNGSAMAPFYTTLSLWVGAVIIAALVKVQTGKKTLMNLSKVKPYQMYFSRLVFFVAIGFLQATLVGLGDIFFLKIQCLHPMWFMAICWLTSFVFVNIVYALTSSFGDVGKAIAVLLLVMQVAGSGGSFPPEMLPHFFQYVYPYLPFVSAMDSMRECIAGMYGSAFMTSMQHLTLFLVPALLLGLLLQKPVEKANKWIEHSLEKTKLM